MSEPTTAAMKASTVIAGLLLGARLAGSAPEPSDYLRDVKPLLKARCYPCHGALKQKAGLRLDNGDAIRRGGKEGPVILTNEIAKSPLLLRVASTNSEVRMPAEGEPLTPEQIDRLRNWIAQGALSPADEKPEPDPREHWAFKGPVRPAVPQIRQAAFRIRNPIDAFILAEQEKRGLKSGPEAGKEVLLRRVYLDLIGLPPPSEALHAFLVDASPEAYEKVVERLLESPQYGERWARHWMDIWRYSDWYGRRHVPDVWNSAPQVWRWRDWIVRSLNSDKGYDRMVVEMLAADEVAPEDDETRAATGYLVRNWYALNPNQWMRDMVEHTGKAFLALTFNCAHCHDHKYDPITQRDYFQFRAFFEPLQVRQDAVKREPDPGPFQKYEYSTPRLVVTNGMVSVFDENLEAKTFIYLRGDERIFPEGKPSVEPAMPAFLRGDSVKPQRSDLPLVAWRPGLKPFFQQAETQKRDQLLAAARDALSTAEKTLLDARSRLAACETADTLGARAKALAGVLGAEAGVRSKSNQVAVAQAEVEAIGARIAADQARAAEFLRTRNLKAVDEPPIAGASPDDLAAAASRAERIVVLRKADARLAESEDALALLQAEQAIGAARRSVEDGGDKKEDRGEASLKKAEQQVAAARQACETAQAALKTNSTAYSPLGAVYPAQSSGRRRALARWIASRENPLTARVAVNHIWARHFHAPLVGSVFDFGRNGVAPTHPALLDWLAVEFMEHGWSMKHLHRLMVTSSAYRQTSVTPERSLLASMAANNQRDPENCFLWRMNPGQMEAEAVRDSLLYLAGELDLTPVGYPLPNADAEKSRHRSLYFECFPEPNGQSQFAELFDPPNPAECYRRNQTIVPQQALALTNSKLSTERSRALSQRLAEKFLRAAGSEGHPPLAPGDKPGKISTDEPPAVLETGFIIAAYQQILTRRPTSEELAACLDFLAKQTKAANTQAACASLVRVLFNHNDFITIR